MLTFANPYFRGSQKCLKIGDVGVKTRYAQRYLQVKGILGDIGKGVGSKTTPKVWNIKTKNVSRFTSV